MPTTIKLKNSVTTTNAPSSLAQGEVAINVTDKKVWVGNAATTPVQLLGDGGSGSFTSIAFGAGTVSAPSITFTGDTNTGIYSPAADTIAFTEGGVESMRIDSSGNVGIGTSSPNSAGVSKALTISGTLSILELNNGANRVGYLFGSDTTKATILSAVQAGSILQFNTVDTERMRIDSSGNVCINTTNAAQSLTINGGIQLDGGGNTRGLYWSMYGAANSGYIDINGLVDGNVMRFGTNNAERMRIDGSGNLLVGMTATGFQNTNAWDFNRNGQAYFNHNSSSGSGLGYALFGFNGGQIGSITQNGTTAVLYNTTSDYRLKSDVKPIQNGLSTISALNPVNFNWSDGRNDDGFLAHELQAIIPNCVTGEKDAVDEDGTPKYQQMDSSGVIPFLVKAIQELNAKVTALEAQLGAK